MTPPNADDPTRSLAPGKRLGLGQPDALEASAAVDDASGWEERLLGFDARLARLGEWPLERRARFLLRADAPRPCSVDGKVWSSLFDEPGRRRPEYVGFFQDLWEDLEQLQIAVAAAGVDAAAVVMAVTVQARQTGWTGRSPLAPVLGGRVFDAFSGLPLPLPYARPSTRDPAWELLGYDVADVFALSGLSNCGYLSPEREALQARFAPALNDHHLFDRPDDADRFRHVCDGRVPEHAPFFVYGLWRVP